MFRKLLLVAGLALLALLILPTRSDASMLTENTSGGYLAPAWATDYRLIHGQLYATDGLRWYVLRSPEFNRGFIRGAPAIVSERWIEAGGSRIRGYFRTPSTFRDQSKTPIFCQGN